MNNSNDINASGRTAQNCEAKSLWLGSQKQICSAC